MSQGRIRAALFLVLMALAGQSPSGQGSARIYFIDIGQGASTLIVSPTGKTMLVDGGPDPTGAKVIALLDTLGIPTVDFTVLTHYHIDHDAGLTGVLHARRVAGTAFDNGDDPALRPPNSGSTQSAYEAYKSAATSQAGVVRKTIAPGAVIDLGGGMRVTCMAAGGKLLSGGQVTISNIDLNTESISLFVEYGNFDFLVSGDLTGGGSTSTAATPDVETFVTQQVGDVDVVQLDHHGSTTASSQRMLSMLKAEVAVAEAGVANTFGHPTRETANRYLNTPVTNGHTFTGVGAAPPGAGPVFYQTDPSPAGDDRVTHQGLHGPAGNGTLFLQTDGRRSYTISSFDDGGTSVPPATYALDGATAGVTTDFPPTVMPSISPAVPLASDTVVVSAAIHDRESAIVAPTLQYAANGAVQPPLAMALVGATYQARMPAQPDGTRVDFTVSASDGTHVTSYASGYFSGVTPINAIRALNARGEPQYAGYAARIEGTVTAGTGTFGNGQNDDYVQDATGAINVYRTLRPASPAMQPMTLGDSVAVAGRIGFNGGRLRLDVTPPFASATTPYLITRVASGPPPAPTKVTIAQLTGAPESFEGRLVSIAAATVTSRAFPPAGTVNDAYVLVSDGTGSLSLKIDHDTDLPGLATPNGPFPLVGIVQQDDYLRPFDSGYAIAPRGRPDVGAPPAGSVAISIAEARADQFDAAGSPGADLAPDRLGQTVKVHGAVTSIDFRGGSGIEYYIQDATAGVVLFSASLNAGPFSIGDSVEAIGMVTHFNGLTEIAVTSVVGLPPGTVPPATPQLVMLSQLAGGGVGEALEGRLVRVESVSITAGAFPSANADGNVTISDATGSATLRIDKNTDIAGTAAPARAFSVTGVVSQFDPTPPFDSGYQLLPRSRADIVVAGVRR